MPWRGIRFQEIAGRLRKRNTTPTLGRGIGTVENIENKKSRSCDEHVTIFSGIALSD